MLRRVGSVRLPPHVAGGYDHADVHLKSGKVYIAHTANGTVEVVDGEGLGHLKTIPGCAEASGVLCAQDDGLVFAAARGVGKVLVVNTEEDETIMEVQVGFRPNGLAWDSKRKQLLVADVADNKARVFGLESRKQNEVTLRGRPRWSLYKPGLDAYLVNIKDPSGLAIISSESLVEQGFLPISVPGPHGLEVLPAKDTAFIACDGGAVVAVDLATGRELHVIPLSGEPDVLWLNAKAGRLYCAIGKPGVIDEIDITSNLVRERTPTEEGAHTLTFDNNRQRLYSLMPRSQTADVYSED